MKSLIYYICTMATEQELRDGAEKNLEACKNQLEMIQNPSPVFIVACTTLSLGILYVMFLIFMAASPAGIWIDSDKLQTLGQDLSVTRFDFMGDDEHQPRLKTFIGWINK